MVSKLSKRVEEVEFRLRQLEGSESPRDPES